MSHVPPTDMIINFIAFQLGWFAVVLGAAQGWPAAGTVAALVIVGWHLRRAARPQSELVLVLSAAAIGGLWDSLLAASGLVVFPNGTFAEGTAPYWIVALWMLFATTLNVSLGWLKRNLALAAAFGAAGGPLAYLAGAKLGALAIPRALPGYAVLALGWALLTPLLILIARRYDGVAPLSAIPSKPNHD